MLPDGSARAWGYNGTGTLGDGTGTERTTPVAVQLGNIARMVGGWTHSMALTAGGSGYAWGGNAYGRLGDGTTSSRPTPVHTYGSVMPQP